MVKLVKLLYYIGEVKNVLVKTKVVSTIGRESVNLPNQKYVSLYPFILYTSIYNSLYVLFQKILSELI
jgi:hypothetical protein